MAEDAHVGADMEVESVNEKRNFNEIHSYACKVKTGGDCDSCPNTPSKNQAPPKNFTSAKEKELSLSNVQENIIRILSEKINERSDQIEKMVKQNSSNIKEVGKSLTSVHNDVMGLQKENENLKNANARLEKIQDQERYSRRWCLHLYRLSEQSTENVMEESWRYARCWFRAEQLIQDRFMRFISRTARDFIWKNSKNNGYLTTNGLRFKEDLTASDREARNRLWSAVEKAKKEGKNAYFSGARAFVDGKEICFEEVQGNR
ncbi:uncharacterized protein LOC107568975 [Tachysurus ichikawai]